MSKVVHTELLSDNPRATADFVAAMFGWKVAKWDAPNFEYYTWEYPGESGVSGAVGGEAEKPLQHGPHVALYVDVDDIADALARAKSLGATQLQGETAIGGGTIGYFAIISLPGGGALGLWCKNPSK